MQIGDVIQTNLYGRKNYKGRKIKVANIQHDIEPGVFFVTGFVILKGGGAVTERIVEISNNRILH